MGFSYYVLSFLNCIHFKKNPHSVVMTGWGLSFINDHHKQRNEYYRGDFQSTF